MTLVVAGRSRILATKVVFVVATQWWFTCGNCGTATSPPIENYMHRCIKKIYKTGWNFHEISVSLDILNLLFVCLIRFSSCFDVGKSDYKIIFQWKQDLPSGASLVFYMFSVFFILYTNFFWFDKKWTDKSKKDIRSRLVKCLSTAQF